MKFTCHIHVPFLRWLGDEPIVLGPGRLEQLAFETWLACEIPAMDMQERRYRATAPLFYTRTFDLAGAGVAVSGDSPLMTALTRERDLLDAALIFGAGTVRGPSVTQSAAYIRPEGDNRVTRSFGPSERELIFFDDTDIAELTRDGAVTTHRIFSKFCRIAERSDFQEILQIAAAIRVGFHPSAERTDAVATVMHC